MDAGSENDSEARFCKDESPLPRWERARLREPAPFAKRKGARKSEATFAGDARGQTGAGEPSFTPESRRFSGQNAM